MIEFLKAIAPILQILFVLICLGLIALVLIQMSRHAGLGGAFGAGATATVFGREEEADPKRTATTWLAVLYMALALLLFIASRP
ncbi:MAG: preprotein translocase subunit SecG [Candidatus Bipolaricaulota bacterium]|nr:preprotein translocase subunit SecG [Candidatus Bipolaricaulota bacterium]MCS7275029.1 preprotein translocase subunit SecG [Candidatus Bipolaricaulota bacterium]MDW8110339.1 preprotein translocase subunit SecG [Candidatus Bipolaricaulota bacterium]MDW8328765.1 preprotein translocase subunit SecG [Candidatus Bipolaricaulota bacterium]